MADLVHHDRIAVLVHLQLAEEAQRVDEILDVDGVPELLAEDLEDEGLQDALLLLVLCDPWNDGEVVKTNVVS